MDVSRVVGCCCWGVVDECEEGGEGGADGGRGWRLGLGRGHAYRGVDGWSRGERGRYVFDLSGGSLLGGGEGRNNGGILDEGCWGEWETRL